jgi:uncharacterized NAD-dependent epimerase/dehydratase family protein
MEKGFDGTAIIYCEGAFNTTNGKTAHGLVRFTERYHVAAVIDSRYRGLDAGRVLDNLENGIRIFSSLDEAIEHAGKAGKPATHFVIGLAPDGGRLPAEARQAVREAIEKGLNVDAGLHDFLTEDPEIERLAAEKNIVLRDIRKTAPRNQLHFFTGEIESVGSLKIALLGTDSAVGKRTTAWILVHALRQSGLKAELIGTGQTAWLQGARYSLIMDSMINDFVSGEIEHAMVSAWKEKQPDVMVIEGQGSLLNPAYPGGFEILAAGRPDIVILQHAPARTDYDGFPGYKIHPLPKQVQAVEVISGKPVVAITINHENLDREGVMNAIEAVRKETGLPAIDVLIQDSAGLVDIIKPYLKLKKIEYHEK